MTVRIKDEVRDQWAAPFAEALRAAILAKPLEDCGTEIPGVDGVTLWKEFHGVRVSIFGNDFQHDRSAVFHCDESNPNSVASCVEGLGVWIHLNRREEFVR